MLREGQVQLRLATLLHTWVTPVVEASSIFITRLEVQAVRHLDLPIRLILQAQ